MGYHSLGRSSSDRGASGSEFSWLCFGLWRSAELEHTSLSSPSLGGCTELLLEPLSVALLVAGGAGVLPCGTPITIPAGMGNQAESFSGPLSTVHNYLPVPAQGYISPAKE